jgi:hypothetical protein
MEDISLRLPEYEVLIHIKVNEFIVTDNNK